MAFRIKVIAEAEAVENSSVIARELKMPAKRAKMGPFYFQVSRTRRAGDGEVFTAETPNILFVM